MHERVIYGESKSKLSLKQLNAKGIKEALEMTRFASRCLDDDDLGLGVDEDKVEGLYMASRLLKSDSRYNTCKHGNAYVLKTRKKHHTYHNSYNASSNAQYIGGRGLSGRVHTDRMHARRYLPKGERYLNERYLERIEDR